MIPLKNIKEFNIDNVSLKDSDSLFFHFCGNESMEVYDSVGMNPMIGKNSSGIDMYPSIFFSKGIEGVLMLWNV